MSHGLPPELSRLGDQLATAAERTRDRRRRRAAHRRRVAAAGLAAGAVILAVLMPAALEPSPHRLTPLTVASRTCEPPRSDKFPQGGCGAPMVLKRPYAVQ
jgi:hypothetical protein